MDIFPAPQNERLRVRISKLTRCQNSQSHCKNKKLGVSHESNFSLKIYFDWETFFCWNWFCHFAGWSCTNLSRVKKGRVIWNRRRRQRRKEMCEIFMHEIPSTELEEILFSSFHKTLNFFTRVETFNCVFVGLILPISLACTFGSGRACLNEVLTTLSLAVRSDATFFFRVGDAKDLASRAENASFVYKMRNFSLLFPSFVSSSCAPKNE